MEKYTDQALELIMNYGPKFLLAIITLIVGLWLIKIFSRFFIRFLNKRDVDPSLKSFLKSLISITLKIALIISDVGMVGVQVTAFIALFASIGVGIGMALSGTLQNVAGGIFILIGFLHHRTGSTELVSLGGVAKTMPLLASSFFIFGLAGMGVPGTNGFIAENLILVSTLKTHTGAGIAALIGIVLAAGYFLTIYQRAFLGPVKNDVVAAAMDLRRRELLLILSLCVLIIIFGIFPNIILDITRSASEAWLNSLKA